MNVFKSTAVVLATLAVSTGPAQAGLLQIESRDAATWGDHIDWALQLTEPLEALSPPDPNAGKAILAGSTDGGLEPFRVTNAQGPLVPLIQGVSWDGGFADGTTVLATSLDSSGPLLFDFSLYGGGTGISGFGTELQADFQGGGSFIAYLVLEYVEGSPVETEEVTVSWTALGGQPSPVVFLGFQDAEYRVVSVEVGTRPAPGTGIQSLSFAINQVTLEPKLSEPDQPLPEPSSIALLGAGLAALGAVARRRRGAGTR